MNPRLFNVLVNLKAYAKNANLGGPGSLRDYILYGIKHIMW